MKRNLSVEKWTLAYRDNLTSECGEIEATVPGNVELDLVRAKKLPQDLYYAENINLVRKYETFDFSYSCEFDFDGAEGKYSLLFLGVDACAEYFLNGTKIGESKNMFVEHEFCASGLVKGKNRLEVKIKSSYMVNNAAEYDNNTLVGDWGSLSPESSSLRRAAHSYGWDIMPRVVSAGIWKEVYLLRHEKNEIRDFCLFTKSVVGGNAQIYATYDISPDALILPDGDYRIKIEGKCIDHEFTIERGINFRAGFLQFSIPSARLWWPKGYGDADLYDFTFSLFKGNEKLSEASKKIGLRTVKIDYCDEKGKENFAFIVNGEQIFVRGTNVTPLSPFHSEEKNKLPELFADLEGVGVNFVRVWGGGVYECDEFYDFCDKSGIMVWQDFMFSCAFYPMREEYYSQIEDEADKVVRRLRSHACIAAYAGDNEIDTMCDCFMLNQTDNEINRHILPRAVRRNDMFTPYIISSPYVSERVHDKLADPPEQHLWADRPYYKSDYYVKTTARFSSEIGIPSACDYESLERFLSKDALSDFYGKEWCLHSTDVFYRTYRITYLVNQAKYLFGFIPDEYKILSKLTQYAQSEALKFFIESFRAEKPQKTGIMWWNMRDGWPQSTEAVVDFYGRRKKAFNVIRRAQEPIALLVGKDNFLHAVNDTLTECKISYKVTALKSGKEITGGEIALEKNGNERISNLVSLNSAPDMLIFEWTTNDGKTHFNHFITAAPPYAVDDFDKWYAYLGEKEKEYSK